MWLLHKNYALTTNLSNPASSAEVSESAAEVSWVQTVCTPIWRRIGRRYNSLHNLNAADGRENTLPYSIGYSENNYVSVTFTAQRSVYWLFFANRP